MQYNPWPVGRGFALYIPGTFNGKKYPCNRFRAGINSCVIAYTKGGIQVDQ